MNWFSAICGIQSESFVFFTSEAYFPTRDRLCSKQSSHAPRREHEAGSSPLPATAAAVPIRWEAQGGRELVASLFVLCSPAATTSAAGASPSTC